LNRAIKLVVLGVVLLAFAWWTLNRRTDRQGTAGVVLLGRAFDPATNLPVTEFRISPMVKLPDGSGIGSNHDFKDADGRFRITDLEPGPVSLTVTAPGHIPWTWNCDPLAGGELRLDIELPLAQRVLLRVLDQDGNKVPGFTYLAMRSLQGRPYPIVDPGGSWTDHLNLHDGEADVVLPGLPIRAVVMVQGLRLPQEIEFDPCSAASQVLTVDLRVTRMFLGCFLGAAADVQPGEVPGNPSAADWEGETGKVWRMDREVDMRFISAAGEVVGTVQVSPRLSRRFLVTWGDPGPANEQLPTWTLPPDAELVRAEAKADGYEPLVIRLGEKRRSVDAHVLVFHRLR
jgi:hypothetical protein